MAKYVTFEKHPQDPKRKTGTWDVIALNGMKLGEIKWFTSWRCYAFYPKADTIFEQQCLRDLGAFCEIQTKEQKA